MCVCVLVCVLGGGGGAVHHALSAAVPSRPLCSDCPMGAAGALGSTNQQQRMIVNGSLVCEFGISREKLTESVRINHREKNQQKS